MIFEKLLQGQPEGIFGIGYNDPSTVGIICTVILLILVFCGVRVVIAAGIAGMIGLVELIGVGPAFRVFSIWSPVTSGWRPGVRDRVRFSVLPPGDLREVGGPPRAPRARFQSCRASRFSDGEERLESDWRLQSWHESWSLES